MAQAKINRKAEKKMKENLLMLEDERRHADQYKEQAEKVYCLLINKKKSKLYGFHMLIGFNIFVFFCLILGE